MRALKLRSSQNWASIPMAQNANLIKNCLLESGAAPIYGFLFPAVLSFLTRNKEYSPQQGLVGESTRRRSINFAPQRMMWVQIFLLPQSKITRKVMFPGPCYASHPSLLAPPSVIQPCLSRRTPEADSALRFLSLVKDINLRPEILLQHTCALPAPTHPHDGDEVL